MPLGRSQASEISDVTINQDIPMAGYKLTGLGAPSDQNDSLRYGQAEIRNNEIAAAANIALTKLASDPSPPSGIIAIWHGVIANIPDGYVICDGNNSTPNLLARFVEGVATAATNPGATGGEATHILTEAELASHTHSYESFVLPSSGSNRNETTADANKYATTSKQARTSGSKGNGGAHQNEPPFYDVAFLMKT